MDWRDGRLWVEHCAYCLRLRGAHRANAYKQCVWTTSYSYKLEAGSFHLLAFSEREAGRSEALTMVKGIVLLWLDMRSAVCNQDKEEFPSISQMELIRNDV
jgi:hypothetical protein